jgi:hypothetical protein
MIDGDWREVEPPRSLGAQRESEREKGAGEPDGDLKCKTYVSHS